MAIACSRAFFALVLLAACSDSGPLDGSYDVTWTCQALDCPAEATFVSMDVDGDSVELGFSDGSNTSTDARQDAGDSEGIGAYACIILGPYRDQDGDNSRRGDVGLCDDNGKEPWILTFETNDADGGIVWLVEATPR
jgi:hypothetical protein